ncbi:MAG: UDP-N-acetylmuramate--L-alanine ligase [Holosporales bacterium]|jgi:UDP-N-acetylmuramate--alanine ligase|nr:UDP-N-acetylmuramate--L-alanine ligase [Holosporales bacterium]
MFAVCDNDNIRVHFIGLGGIGVSGIAEILHSLGYIVQGSDKAYSQNIERLEKLGIVAFIGHDEKNVENSDIVVFSSAIKPDNPELKKARELKIPCLPRAEMLSQLVRLKKSVVVAGSHGKTTVTSICASILDMASLSPTIFNGGIINAYKTNAKIGSGDWAVIESDESDGSFTQFFPTIGIITNIDKEHILNYGSFENLKSAFKAFINNLPFYGAGIVCIDDKNVADIIKDVYDRKIITYGIDKPATFNAINIRKDSCGSMFHVKHFDDIIEDVSIPLLGNHNILNALSAIAMSYELKIDINIVKSTLASFAGVDRRFTNLGRIGDVAVIDDYAHHPTEIKTLLKSARQRTTGKITIICQPHRFTRLNTLFKEFCGCFDEADKIIIVPVYKADDAQSAKLTSTDLYENLKSKDKDVKFANDKNELENLLKNMIDSEELKANDIILFAGAGDISKWAREIVSKIGCRS